MTRFVSRLAGCSGAIGLLASVSASWAQTAPPPDVGRVLQEAPRPVQPLAPSAGLVIREAVSAQVQPGGAQVTLKAVRFTGANRYADSDLQALLANGIGQSLDLAGLRALADRISAHYRSQGFPFARAFLPPQDLADGQLLIQIVEGRYGRVLATGAADLAAAAQPFLFRLKPGALIEAAALERATLILGDLPGLVSAPAIAPGEAVGAGDLLVEVTPTPRWNGELGADNEGSRYTGTYRLRASVAATRLALLGDELQAGLMHSDRNLALGNASYSLPLGSDGTRSQFSVAQTQYQLGGSYAALGAQGRARTAAATVSHPVVRSVPLNVLVSASLQGRRLHDESTTPATAADKRSQGGVLSLQFDRRDGDGGGGISYGSLSWTTGHLSLDATTQVSDAQGKRSAGRYNKGNVDLNRLQSLPAGISLLARLAGQVSAGNLDASEAYSLGGANGVRAYPQGEATGDSGWLAQAELRRAVDAAGSTTASVFVDAGRVRYSHTVFQPGPNHRGIAGAGVGLRTTQGPFSADATLAWRTRGGPAQSDSRDSRPRLGSRLTWRF